MLDFARFTMLMVGHPKHLSDLDKIEADVRIICRACGYEHDWDRESLSRWLLRTGGSTVWSEITHGMTCRGRAQGRPCKGTNLFAIPLPFSHRPANAPVTLHPVQRQLLDGALAILCDAARRSTKGPVGTPEVRLALLVAYVFDRDPVTAADFWKHATATDRRGNVSCHHEYEGIRRRLARRGLIAPERGDF